MSRPAWADAFLNWLRERDTTDWCEIRIHRGDRWTIHHLADPPDGLTPVDDFRELAKYTAAGRYRPLPTEPSLRRGWIAVGLTDDQLVEAVEELYPATIAIWAAERAGRLEPIDWDQVSRRQTGLLGLVKRLEEQDLERAIAVHCADRHCLRRIVWNLSDSEPLALGHDGVVPCPEACSVLVSFLRQVIGWRRGDEIETDDPWWAEFVAGG